MKKHLLLLFLFFLSSCIKVNNAAINNNLLFSFIIGNFYQEADEPFQITTIKTNEKGAADLDGIGERSSFVSIPSIQYYENTLYILDNTRRLIPKIKTLDPNTKELKTLSTLSTGNQALSDMAFTVDGFFFLSSNKIFYYSRMDELKTGNPTNTIELTSANQNNFSLSLKGIKINSESKTLYLSDTCNIYKISYSSFPTKTSITPIYTAQGCGNNSSSGNKSISSFAVDPDNTLYLYEGGSIKKQTASGGSSILFSFTSIYDSYRSYVLHYYNSDLYFQGNVPKGNITERQLLLKTNPSNPVTKYLAGGVYSSLIDITSQDSFGSYAGIGNILYLTNDSQGNLYFIDNYQLLVGLNNSNFQRVRKASKY